MSDKKTVGDLKVKIGLDSIELDSGIKKLSGDFNKIEREFKIASVGLNKFTDASKIAALQIDKLTQQTAVQSKIVEQFRQAHQKASEQHGASSKEAQKYELSLKKSELQLVNLEKQLKSATAELEKQNSGWTKASNVTKVAGDAFGKAGQALTNVGKTMTMNITAPILAVGAALLKLADTAAKTGEELTMVADRTGLSITKLQELKYVSSNLDLEFSSIQSTLGVFVSKMKGLDSESNTYTEGMRELGVATKDSNGQTKAAGDVYMETISKLSEMRNETDRNILAAKLFGKGYLELTPILNASQEEIARLTKEAHENGVILSEEAVRAAEDYGDSVNNLKAQFQAVNVEIAGKFMPIIQDKLIPMIKAHVIPALKGFGDKISSLITWFSNLDSGTQKTIGVMAGIVVAAGPLLVVLGQVTLGIGGLSAALTFLLAHPVVLAIAGIAAVLGILVYNAGEADRAVQSMTRSLIANYQAEAEAQKAAIDLSHKTRIDALNARLVDEDIAYDQRMTQIQDEYDADVKAISGREQALRKSLQERSRILDDNHKKAIDRIQDEYGVFETKQKSKTELVQENAEEQKELVKSVLDLSKDIATQEGDAFVKTYDAILAKAKDIHDEKMRMYQTEYLKSVMLINQDLAKKVGGFQSEIDALNQKTEEEERILKEQENNQKIIDLQAKVDTAKSYSEYTAASQALATEINRQNREKELINRQIQIESLNKQIQNAAKTANDEKQKALTVLQTKTGEQQVVIDRATASEIAAIQRVRIAKEIAETKKYNAAKSAIEREEVALDGWGERYKLALDEQLKVKQQIEKMKLLATTTRINNELKLEQQKITGEKQKVDRTFEAQKIIAQIDSIAAEISKIQNKPWINKDIIFDTINIKNLETQMAELKKYARAEGLPGFAAGVTNWRGGLARVNEKGGEIQYLKQGTTVIPNDISMQMARSVGASNSMAETNALLRELLDRTGNSQIVLDNRVVGEAIMPSIFSAASRQGKAWPVRT